MLRQRLEGIDQGRHCVWARNNVGDVGDVGDVSKSPSPWIVESRESRLESAEPEAIFDRAIPEGVN